jgi:hypothetical protein
MTKLLFVLCLLSYTSLFGQEINVQKNTVLDTLRQPPMVHYAKSKNSSQTENEKYLAFISEGIINHSLLAVTQMPDDVYYYCLLPKKGNPEVVFFLTEDVNKMPDYIKDYIRRKSRDIFDKPIEDVYWVVSKEWRGERWEQKRLDE